MNQLSVQDAFHAALNGLFLRSERRARDVADAVGLSEAIVSKLRTGARNGASFATVERLRHAFNVPAYLLFKPDLTESEGATIPVVRFLPPKRVPGSMVGSSPTLRDGGAHVLAHADPELLVALIAFWDALSPDGRLDLLGYGHRLRQAESVPDAQPSRTA